VKDLGGEVVRGEVGDVNVAYLARELNAALGVEAVGVYIIPEAGFYPDSIFATLTLLSSIKEVGEIRQFFRAMPRLFFSKSKVSCSNQAKESVMAQIKQKSSLFAASHVNDLDGLRFEFADSWMLIRASGTEPAIRVIVESTSDSETQALLRRGVELVQELVKEAGQ
jgi:phosphomannomutase